MHRKVILFLVCLFITSLGFSQVPYYNAHNYGNEFNRVLIDTDLSFQLIDTSHSYTNLLKPRLRVNSSDTSLYLWNGLSWNRLSFQRDVVKTKLSIYPDTIKIGSPSSSTLGKTVPIGIYTNGDRAIFIDTSSTFTTTVTFGDPNDRNKFINKKITLNVTSGNVSDLQFIRTDSAASISVFRLIPYQNTISGQKQLGRFVSNYEGDGTTNKMWWWFSTIDALNTPKFAVSEHLVGVSEPLVISPNITTHSYTANAWVSVENGSGSLPSLAIKPASAQVVNNIEWYNPSAIKMGWVTAGGNLHTPTISILGDTSLTANLTLDTLSALRQKQIFRFNTSSGSKVVSLITSNFSNGRILTFLKTTADVNTVVITPTTGTIGNGASSFTIYSELSSISFILNKATNNWDFYSGNQNSVIGLKNGVAHNQLLSTDVNGNFTLVTVDTAAGHNYIAASQFGAVVDYKRTWITTTSGSPTIGSASGTFLPSDTGKIIVIHKVRSKSYYTGDSLSIVAKIVTYNNSSSVDISITPNYSFIDSVAYFGTNSFDAIQNALDNAVSRGIGNVVLDYVGTYLIAPQYSNLNLGNYKGFHLNGQVHLSGFCKNMTNLKFAYEDLDVDTANNLYYGFVKFTSGANEITHLSMIAPDRFTIKNVNLNLLANRVIDSTITGEYNLVDVNVICDSSAKRYFPNDWYLQWGVGFFSSCNAASGFFTLNETDYTHQVGYLGNGLFSNEGYHKRQIAHNVTWEGSGSPNTEQYLTGCASINNGNDTLTISGLPHFTWYAFNSSDDGFAFHYKVRIYNGANVFSDTMATIVSSTKVVLKHNSTHTFTNDSIYIVIPQNMIGDGMQNYIHHNIDLDYDNVTSIDAKCLDLQSYSGHGGAGEERAKSHRFNQCTERPGRRNLTSHGWFLGHQNNTDIPTDVLITNCQPLFDIYGSTQPFKVRIYNTTVEELSMYDSMYLSNVTGTFLHASANAQSDTCINCYFTSADMGSTTTGTLALLNSTIGSIANFSSAGGVINTFGGNIGPVSTRTGTINIQTQIGNTGIITGVGSPAGAVAAKPGTLYLDEGGAMYLKTSGTGTSGWTAK